MIAEEDGNFTDEDGSIRGSETDQARTGEGTVLGGDHPGLLHEVRFRDSIRRK